MIFSSRSSKFNIICIFVVLICIYGLFIKINVPVVQEHNFYKTAEQTYGTVDKIEEYSRYAGRSYVTDYHCYISYTTLDGTQYNNIKAKYVNIKEDKYEQGNDVIVAYDKNNPTITGVGSFAPYSDILGSIFLLILMVVIMLILLKLYKELRLCTFLINNGTTAFAKITNITSWGFGQYRAYTVYYSLTNPITNIPIYNFKKIDQRTIPTVRNLCVGQLLPAYFDPRNPAVYCIKL